MAPSVTAALRLKQMLKQCLKLSDADITAQQPNSVPGPFLHLDQAHLSISQPFFFFSSLSQLKSALDGDSSFHTGPDAEEADKEGAEWGWVPPYRDAILQPPLSPPWDAAGGFVTLSSGGGSSKAPCYQGSGLHSPRQDEGPPVPFTKCHRGSEQGGHSNTAVPYSSDVLSYPF